MPKKRQSKAQPTPEQVAERTKRHREMEQSIRESAERMCKGNADILDYPDIKRNMQTTDLYAKAVAVHEALEVVVEYVEYFCLNCGHDASSGTEEKEATMNRIDLYAWESEVNDLAGDCDGLARQFSQIPTADVPEIGQAREAINGFSNAVRSAVANPAAASEAVLIAARARAVSALGRLRSLSEGASDF